MKSILFCLAITLVSFVSSAETQRAARYNHCLLVVDGETYFKGVCWLRSSSLPGGSFSVHSDTRFVHLEVTSPGVAEAKVNTQPGATYTRPLGTLNRYGKCWINEHVTLCI